MKILVIGQSVEDHIVEKNGIKIKPGGIFYSTLGLTNYAEPGDEIFLATSFEDENYHLFEKVFEKVNKKYFQKVDSIPRVLLDHHKSREREEKYENLTQTLNLNFDDLNMYGGILINMITGFDITLEQLKKIRKKFKGIIYFDVHTLSRGIDNEMKREFRVIPDFIEWAKCIDIIQVNETELLYLTPKKNEKDTVRELFKAGVKHILITMGKKGSKGYSGNGNEIESIFVSSLKVDAKNRVGCGDIFGAVFFYNFIKFNNFNNALKAANIAGSCAAMYDNFSKYKNLREDVTSRYN